MNREVCIHFVPVDRGCYQCERETIAELTAEVESLKKSDERAHGLIHYYENKWIKERDTNQRLRDAALWIINNWVCDREDGTISEDLCGRYNLCRRCSLIKALEGEGK